MQTNLQKDLAPDLDAIRSHLEFLFGDIRGFDDGLIELSYTPPNSSAVNKSAYFDGDDLEGAAAKAFELNSQEGVNVYVGASLRSPDTAPFGRSNIEDYYASSVIWCDLDDAKAAKEAVNKYKNLPPSLVVVTGREPNTRAQAWWKLATLEDNKDLIKENLAHICSALDGDPAVVDAARVMRLGGTIAYPKKDGRVKELTEVITPSNATKLIMVDNFKSYFDIPKNKAAAQSSANSNFKEPLTGNFKINELLENTRNQGQWHLSIRDAIAAMVGKGWNDEQIKISCAPYCDAGANDPDLIPLIATARHKYDMPDMQVEAELFNNIEVVKDFSLQDWVAKDIFKGIAPEIEWLVEGIFPLGVPILLAAMGGLGKSFSVLDLAIKIASQAPTIEPVKAFGGDVIGKGKVVYITAEDSKNSIHRRINALVNEQKLEQTDENLIVLPMPEIGHQLLITENNDGLVQTDFFKLIQAELEKLDDVKLIAFDPLQAFVGADITSKPEVGQFVWSCFSSLCAKTGATLLCTHHMRKDGLKNIKTAADAREAIRGSTALIDGARLAYAMWQADEGEGYKIAQAVDEEYEPHKFVKGAVVKTNDIADQSVHSYFRQETGILKDLGNVNISDVQDSGLSSDQARQALREIRMAWESGNPFRASSQSPRDIVKWLMKNFKLKREQAVWQRDAWMCPNIGSKPLVEERIFKDERRKEKAGLYVVDIP